MKDLLIDFDFFCHGVWNGNAGRGEVSSQNGSRQYEAACGQEKSFGRNSALLYEFVFKVSV